VRPETRYARVGDDHVAYQVLGRGRRDVALIPAWFGHVEAMWDLTPLAGFMERLSAFARLVVFDRRGTGLSDPAPAVAGPFLEQFSDDLVAVLDAAGSERATLIGCDGGGPVAAITAATYPQRVEALVLVNTFARMAEAPDYPPGVPQPVLDGWLAHVDAQLRGDSGFELTAPSAVGDEELNADFTRLLRQSASPRVANATRRILHAVDVRDILGSVQVPTLVIHRRGDRMIRLAHGRYLAERIPGARLVEVPGDDHLFYIGDADAILDEIEEFITGARRVAADRVLSTVLFTDIASSTEQAVTLGDRRWRDLLDEHDRTVERLVTRFNGSLVKGTGDGVLATFDGPGRAVTCAMVARDAVQELGLRMRAGLHTGEVERRGDDITGLAVVIGRRICDLADPSEILVSRTVTDLVVGSELCFSPKGAHELKGVPGDWQLFTVAGAGSVPR
jgi:pimeloyl-ACP methyl ester carboxylesterase